MKMFLGGACVALLLTFFLFFVVFFLQSHSLNSQEKNLPFECGFTMIKSPRIPFSTRYFLLTVVFLVFDIELVLLFPLMGMNKTSPPICMLLLLSVFFILMGGTLYEYKEGSFDWMK